MKRIAYAEEWLTTDDDVADLVLVYARALARHDTADTISIPVVEGDAVRNAQFLIGPASQIIVVDSDEAAPPDLDGREAVTELQARIDRLASPNPVLYESGDDSLRGTLPDF
jgi:hypothetical protein